MRRPARVLGVACLAASLWIVLSPQVTPPPQPRRAVPTAEAPTPAPPNRTREHLLAATLDAQCLAEARLQARLAEAVRRACDTVKTCVSLRKEAIPALTSDCFDLGTTWDLVWSSDEEGRAGVRRLFERHVISPEWMERLFALVAEDFAADARAAQDEYLLTIAADVEDACVEAPGVSAIDLDAVKRLVCSLRTDVRACAGVQVANSVVTEVVLAGVARFLIARGAIAAGAATSWCTFGIGLVIGLVVDYFICLYYEDQAGERVAAGLDELAEAIIHGREGEEGLSDALEAEARRLRHALNASVREAVDRVAP